MPGTFVATADAARNLLRYRLEGFFDAADIDTIRTARQSAHTELTCAANQHYTLCDVSGCKLQAQDVLAMLGQLIGESAHRAQRLAFVTGDSLIRMQLRRLVAHDPERIGVFETTLAAEYWLTQAGMPRAA